VSQRHFEDRVHEVGCRVVGDDDLLEEAEYYWQKGASSRDAAGVGTGSKLRQKHLGTYNRARHHHWEEGYVE